MVVTTLLLILDLLLLAFTTSTDDFLLTFSYGLNNPDLNKSAKFRISCLFSGFQFVMPLLGFLIYEIVYTYCFKALRFVPFVLLGYLLIVGFKLILEGIFHKLMDCKIPYDFKPKDLFLHGFLSSLDALAVGLTLENPTIGYTLLVCAFLAFMTFARCISSFKLSLKLHGKIPYHSGIVSGIIIVIVAIVIFLQRIHLI